MSAGSSRRVSSMRRSRARASSWGESGSGATKRQAPLPARRTTLESCLQRRAKVGRNSGESSGGIDGDKRGMSGSEPGARLRIGDQIVEGDRSRANARQCGLDAHEVVEPSRREIANAHLRHGETDAIRLEGGIASSERAQQLHASHLAPHEVVRVVHDTHPVCFSVPNPKFGRVYVCHARDRGWEDRAARRLPGLE